MEMSSCARDYRREVSKAMRDARDAEADRFDDEPDHRLRDPSVRQAWTTLLKEFLPPPPARVLDLGCGTGTLAVLLAELGHEVVGVDLSPRMLQRAEEKARQHGVEVDLRLGDAGAPPVDGRFGALVVRHVLWALPGAPAVLDRWVGLLGPRGVLVQVEGHWHTGAGWRAEDLLPLVQARTTTATLRHVSGETALRGADATDERYLIAGQV